MPILAVVLFGTFGVAVAGPASARVDGQATGQETAVTGEATWPTPADGEDLNTYLRRTAFPKLAAGQCLAGFMYLPGDTKRKVPIPPCGVHTYHDWGFPPLSAGEAAKLRTLPATKLAEKIAAVAELSVPKMSTALATEAGLTVAQLSTRTGEAVVKLILGRDTVALGGVPTSDPVAEGKVCGDFADGVVCSVPRPAWGLLGKLGKFVAKKAVEAVVAHVIDGIASSFGG